MPNTLVLVIEQEEGKLFNRGALLNIGFNIYKNKTKYFMTHDVDINPTEFFIKSKYNIELDKNSIQGLFTSVCDTLGGIIKISNDDIREYSFTNFERAEYMRRVMIGHLKAKIEKDRAAI